MSKEMRFFQIPPKELKDPSLRMLRKCMGIWAANVLVYIDKLKQHKNSAIVPMSRSAGKYVLEGETAIIFEWLDLIMDVVTQEHPSYAPIKQVYSISFRVHRDDHLVTLAVIHDEGRQLQITFYLPAELTDHYNDIIDKELPPLGSIMRVDIMGYLSKVQYWISVNPRDKKNAPP